MNEKECKELGGKWKEFSSGDSKACVISDKNIAILDDGEVVPCN